MEYALNEPSTNRYTYDPLVQSLNDNSDNELNLAAGDYVLVWSDVDEVSLVISVQ